ncbi:MAG: YgeY family selenium metabolism-linked hydrolase [Clostridia bacterium]|nr:YgeY family selenium metabolism-linked hydrolase [Clostridia bacterium]
MNKLEIVGKDIRKDLQLFAQELVRIKSTSGNEETIIRFIASKMKALGYDEVVIDGFGNVVGRVGSGEKAVMFDSHVDTVEVKDAELWKVPPFSGEIIDGWLWGRGSVDMKSGAAASIYAAAVAKSQGLLEGKRVYVSCTIFEEDCDGENLKHMFKELQFRPDFFVTCEPSGNIITTGHKGKAQIVIKTQGVSAHGSAPEKGVNAIYEMAEIINRVEKTNLELMTKAAPKGTLVMSRISSTGASLNAVPSECEVYLDRRMVVGETEETIKKEIEKIIKGKNATWEIGTLHRKTWTGMDITYEPFHLAWEIPFDHKLTKAFIDSYKEVFGTEPGKYDFWDFSTNAVATVSMGIPTIGFGPGEYKLAHMTNERCEISQIIDACSIYTNVISKL